MKILVTGGTGYIGSHTVVELLQAGHDVEIIDNLSNSKVGVLDKIEMITGVRPKFQKADLLDVEAIDAIMSSGFDAVMHFAGLKAVAESVEKPLLYYENNIGGTINLLNAMQKYGVKKIVFSSSATVYGEPKDEGACSEEMPTGRGITNPYGRTKYMIEEMLKDLCAADSEFSAVILRYFNPVGAHPSGKLGEDPNGIPNNLMPIVMKVAKGEIEKLSVYGDDYPTDDGSCVRDYVHVVDLAKGHLAALSKTKNGVSIFNLGTGKGTSVLEMVTAFERASGKKLPFEIVGRRAGDLPILYANVAKAERELGWRAELTVDDAMKDTLTYLSAE